MALFRGFSQIMLAFRIRHAREEAAAIDPARPSLTRPTCRGAGVTGGCQSPPAAAAQLPARGVPTTRPRNVSTSHRRDHAASTTSLGTPASGLTRPAGPQRAATALDDIGQGKRVDRVSLAMLDLRKGARTCDERKVLVAKLRSLDDPRALPALRELRGRNFGPFRVGSTDTGCMKKELPEAIKALEKKAGVPERRTRRGR